MMPPMPPFPKMGVNPEQLRNQVEIYKVDIALREREIFTLQELGKQQRAFNREIASANGIKSISVETLNLALKAHESALVEMKRLELIKVKSALAIAEAMLAEVDKLVQGVS
jgi:hypothetical protein